jgi:shikimate kinase
MKIVLLGYMGSGKSSIGKLLAKQFSYTFVDLDEYISKKEQNSVSEIFKNKGEIYFRKKETEYLLDLLQLSESFILAVGGGTPCFGNNMTLLSKMATTIYLKTSINTLVHRLKLKKNKRPLISHLSEEDLPEFIGKHLFERTAFYQQSKFTIVIDDKTEKEIVSEIVSTLS